jgi:ABC-type antimicrobial peptide transport system permease subunit
MALGARASEVGWMVLRRSLIVTLAGVFAGVAAAFMLTSFMSSLLYGVDPLDPLTFLAVPVVLTAVAILATWLPARRAARTDPLAALRFD